MTSHVAIAISDLIDINDGWESNVQKLLLTDPSEKNSR